MEQTTWTFFRQGVVKLLGPRRAYPAWPELTFQACLPLSVFSLCEHHQQVPQCGMHAAGPSPYHPRPCSFTCQRLVSSPPLPQQFLCFTLWVNAYLPSGFSLSHLQSICKAATKTSSLRSHNHTPAPFPTVEDKKAEPSRAL